MAVAAPALECHYSGLYLINPGTEYVCDNELIEVKEEGPLQVYVKSASVKTFFQTDPISEVITPAETPSITETPSQFQLKPCFYKMPAAYSCRTRSPTQLLSCYVSSSLELHPTTTITISASLPEPLATQAASYGLLPSSVMPPTHLSTPTSITGGLCLYCRVSRGLTLRCSHRGCNRSYHLMCHFYAGGLIRIYPSSQYSGGSDQHTLTYCLHHAPLYGYSESFTQLEQCLLRNRQRQNTLLTEELIEKLLKLKHSQNVPEINPSPNKYHLICHICNYGYFCPPVGMDAALKENVDKNSVVLNYQANSSGSVISSSSRDLLDSINESLADISSHQVQHNELLLKEGERGCFWMCCVCGCTIHESCFDMNDYEALWECQEIKCNNEIEY